MWYRKKSPENVIILVETDSEAPSHRILAYVEQQKRRDFAFGFTIVRTSNYFIE
jgi:hypothetical protein